VSQNGTITSYLDENRRFLPSKEFLATAGHTQSEFKHLQKLASGDPLAFWDQMARELQWQHPWTQTLQGEAPFVRWFEGGKINASQSCLDRHAHSWRKNKAAIIWEGEEGEVVTLTYGQLHKEVSEFAALLRSEGVGVGDRVAIYLPLIPQCAVAMLACARIGAIHTVIFAGFSSDSVRDRVHDSQCKMIITADGGRRKGKIIQLKKIVDDALSDIKEECVKTVLVYSHLKIDMAMKAGRDWLVSEKLAQLKNGDQSAASLDASHPLFILYTSGTTGKPKGIIHSTAGYLTQVSATAKWVFDFKDEDIFWCTADVGWITGHSYLVYGPLANGATVFMYEGAPLYPAPDRFWSMIEKHKVTILYTAPTAIRTFMQSGDEHIKKHDLSSLRLLGSVGEPINPKAWMWYHSVVGQDRCPIVDTWWQTETGGIMISPVPTMTATTPGSATYPFPGIDIDIFTQDGKTCEMNDGGYLVVKSPWPGMAQGIWGDNERFLDTYWSKYPSVYYTGDGARRDEHGNFWLMGRVDDVVNVSGHRLGTMEIESALVSHEVVAEAAVVAIDDEITGQALVAFVTLKNDATRDSSLHELLRNHVAQQIGAFAKPKAVRIVEALPKTRSGKIMRRLLRELAQSGQVHGDTTTLEDIGVLQRLKELDQEEA